MSRDQLSRRYRRVLGRLAEPSSAAGLAALLALLIPDLAREAPTIVDMALTARSPPSLRSFGAKGAGRTARKGAYARGPARPPGG